MRKLRLLLFLLALGIPAQAAPGTNWLSTVTGQITQLTTAYGNALVDIGNMELAYVAVLALVTIASRWQLDHMVIGYHPVNFRVGDFVVFLVKLLFCSALLYYYNNPLPGGLNVHQLPQAVGSSIAEYLDASMLDGLTDRITAAIDGTKAPSAFDASGIAMYFVVMVVMSVFQFVAFIMNAFGFLLYAVFALLGPLFIPLLMTVHFQGKFWVWLDGLIVFGMYPAVASAVTFIWAGLLIYFFDHSVAGDYSIGNWMSLFGSLILLSLSSVLVMFSVPLVTSMLFGGVAGSAQSFADSTTRWIGRAAGAAL